MRKKTYRPAVLLSTLLAASFLGALSLAAGCATAPESTVNEESSAEPVLSKSEWLDSLHADLTHDLCSEDQVFRSCYSVTEHDCRERVNDIAASCESQYLNEVPEALSALEGRHWGGRIGKCTGDGLFNAVSANYSFNETASCSQLLSEM
jgi:hypothetical protein